MAFSTTATTGRARFLPETIIVVLVQGPQARSPLPAFQPIIQSAQLSWTHRKSRWPRLVMSKGINRRSCPLWECRKRARYLTSSRQTAIVFSCWVVVAVTCAYMGSEGVREPVGSVVTVKVAMGSGGVRACHPYAGRGGMELRVGIGEKHRIRSKNLSFA